MVVHSSKRLRSSVVSGPKRDAKMVRKRNPRVEYRTTAKVAMADRPEEYRKEPVSGYPAADAGKQNIEHSSLSQGSVTSTGDIVSPNGIRLWGMW